MLYSEILYIKKYIFSTILCIRLFATTMFVFPVKTEIDFRDRREKNGVLLGYWPLFDIFVGKE